MFTAHRFCHRRPTGFNVTSGPTFIGTPPKPLPVNWTQKPCANTLRPHRAPPILDLFIYKKRKNKLP